MQKSVIILVLGLVIQARADVRTEYFGMGKYVNGERQWSYRTYDGSVEATFDDDGKNLGANRYGAFGARISNVGEANDREAFQGQDFRKDVDHYNLGVRNMSPDSGRWLQPEPLLISGGAAPISPYRYASNNSINRTDPSGLADKGYSIVEHPNGTPFDSFKFTEDVEVGEPGFRKLSTAFARWGDIIKTYASRTWGGRWVFEPVGVYMNLDTGIHFDGTSDGTYATRGSRYNAVLTLYGEGTLVYKIQPRFFKAHGGDVELAGRTLESMGIGHPALGKPISVPSRSTLLINGVTLHSSPPLIEGAPPRVTALGMIFRSAGRGANGSGGGGNAAMMGHMLFGETIYSDFGGACAAVWAAEHIGYGMSNPAGQQQDREACDAYEAAHANDSSTPSAQGTWGGSKSQ